VANSTLITDYLGSGTLANRPATPPVAKLAFYYATDNATLYQWTGTAWATVGGGGGGGGSSFPFTFVQEVSGNNNNANAGSFTLTFPQTATLGNTLFCVASTDGQSATNTPTGWTKNFDQQQATYARIILFSKPSDGTETAITVTSVGSSSFALWFFELVGARTFSTYLTGGAANPSTVPLPSITPTGGAAVFGVAGYVSGGVQNPVPTGLAINPQWHAFGTGGNGNAARVLSGVILNAPAPGTPIVFPRLPIFSLYSGTAGVAWASFSVT
jgi:hypothetical protein